MEFSYRIGSVARKTVLVGGVFGASAVASLPLTHPAAAAALLAAVQSAVTCASTGTTACVSGTNTSSGVGVLGASKTGTGLRGSSTTNDGVKGTSTSGDGVLGQSTSNTGVSGSSTSGYGVTGSSTSGYGVSGSSTYGAAGVIGTTAENNGVFGNALDYGNGVSGQSSQGYGVYGTTTNGSGTAIFGYESSSGTGVYGESAGGGTGGLFESSYEGVVGQSGEYPLVGRDASGTGVFYVDNHGDILFGGGLMQFSLASRSGNVVKSFTAKMTLPTVEDTGTAQLIGGVATVRLDQTFAASIEPTNAYRVFLTPAGDTRGLFVASRTAAGFIVREAQGGRSTVSFDYRIVATALGQSGQRMATTSRATLPSAARPSMPLRAPSNVP